MNLVFQEICIRVQECTKIIERFKNIGLGQILILF